MVSATSLWLDVKSAQGAEVLVTLSRCRNCGKTKVTSDPCGFDHLAALMEFRAPAKADDVAPPPPTRQETAP